MLSPAIIGLALYGIAVEGTSTCPTPVAVGERLQALGLEPRGGVARLESVDAGLRLTLRRADGTEAGSRTIAPAATCEELTEAVAVMIATWQEAPPPAPLPPPPPVVAPPPPPVVVAPPAPAPAPWRWELGAGVGAGLAGAELAPSALLMGSVGGLLGLDARALVSGERDTVLPDGSARWRRALLAVGPHLRREGTRVFGEAHVGAGVSWLSIRGRGFSDSQSHDDVVGGLEAGARLAWNRRGARPWFEVEAAFWPARSLVYQLPDQRSAALPRFELLAALGLSFGR